MNGKICKESGKFWCSDLSKLPITNGKRKCYWDTFWLPCWALTTPESFPKRRRDAWKKPQVLASTSDSRILVQQLLVKFAKSVSNKREILACDRKEIISTACIRQQLSYAWFQKTCKKLKLKTYINFRLFLFRYSIPFSSNYVEPEFNFRNHTWVNLAWGRKVSAEMG